MCWLYFSAVRCLCCILALRLPSILAKLSNRPSIGGCEHYVRRRRRQRMTMFFAVQTDVISASPEVFAICKEGTVQRNKCGFVDSNHPRLYKKPAACPTPLCQGCRRGLPCIGCYTTVLAWCFGLDCNPRWCFEQRASWCCTCSNCGSHVTLTAACGYEGASGKAWCFSWRVGFATAAVAAAAAAADGAAHKLS